MRLIYEETVISITIKGHGDPAPYVHRLMALVEPPPVCAECSSVIDGPVQERDDGADLCRDCYERLYAERDALDTWYVDGDRRYDQAREDGRRW